MKKIVVLLIAFVLLGSCVSVKKYNRDLNVLRKEKQLKSDVDYISKKLQRLHPRLYWYISKKDLDYKFDSLKSTITTPMTSNDFFLKLSPVLASVKQGHLEIIPLVKKMKRKDKLALKHSGTSPLYQFDYDLYDNNLYIIKNRSNDTSIKAGTEIVTVNNIKPQELISKYRSTISSDGFNQTYINRNLSKNFPVYYFFQYGKTDSVLYQLKYKDTVRIVCIKRKTIAKGDTLKNEKSDKHKDFEKKYKEDEKRRDLGYDKLTERYSKNLNFLETDSSIAVMKINDFYRGSYRHFYRNSFKQMDSLKTKYLILDLRDNPGGKLKEVYELYSYFVDSDYYFLDKPEVVSRTSLLHNNYFKGKPLYEKVILVVFSPFKLISMGITLFKVKKGEDNKYYISITESKIGHPKTNIFKGKVFVLINGGSFSATSLLSANLKSAKKAIFIGEETGGAYNGCVAGSMYVSTLPKSKLNVVFGLSLIQPYHKTDLEGRGIFPDIEIKPVLSDWINGNDPELKWVLDEIKGHHTTQGHKP